MSDLVASILVALLLVVGLVGVLVPVLPGLVFMWCAALVYGLLVGFGGVGIAAMSVLTVLTIVSVVLGVILPKQAATEAGAARRSQLVGAVGAVIGFFVIPVVGFIVGALVGLLAAEYYDKRDFAAAWATTKELAKGFGISTLIQFGIGFAMLLVWSIWALTVLT